MDINQIINKIKAAGIVNTRILPMEGHDPLNGLQKIEIKENGHWHSIISNVPKIIAEQAVTMASNRVILG